MFTDVRNPKWTGANHKTILLEVKMNNEWADFVASPTDCTDYGPVLYNSAVNGTYGAVADSDEERIIAGELPAPDGYVVQDGQLINVAAYEQEATAELNRRFAELNSEEAKAHAEIDDEYAAERKTKIAALLAVKTQPGWPITVEWPERTV